jgi:predicted metal-binding membrane protein
MSAGNPFSPPRSRSPSASNPNQTIAVIAVASTLAWLAIFWLHDGVGGSWHGFFHHPATATPGENVRLWGHSWLPSAQWLGGWFIMVVAMMLPPALPFLQAMQRLTDGLPSDRALVASAAAAFIAAWTLAGVILVVTGNLLSSLLGIIPGLAERPMLVSGLAAIFVGAYQLSPLKQTCLTACRSPTAIVLLVWNQGQPWRSAIAIGMRYGFVCIGCCWTLMLLTLVVGAFVLPLMVIVSVIMLLERLLPSVRPLVPLQAALACAIGILLLFGSLPPGLDIGRSGTPVHLHHQTKN